MGETKKLHFTYDPLFLVGFALQRYAEELEGKDTKAIQFARYEYLRTLSNDELEELLQRYIKEENLEFITLEDWRKDSEILFSYIYESDRYKAIEFNYKKMGFGVTGLGVVDKSDNTFYDCEFTGHWKKVMEIVKEKYPKFNEALEEMYFNEKLNEFKGISREEIDAFIMERFELIGGNKVLNDYIS